MTKEKYNTKDIKHIDEKSQEYIAKGNRMTEVLNCDYERIRINDRRNNN